MICFRYSTTNYFFSNPSWGNSYQRDDLTAYGRSASGKLYRYSKNVSILRQILRWEGMNQAERTQMETAFAAIGTNDFDLIDHQGKMWTARFTSGQLSFEEIADDKFSEESFFVAGEKYPSSIRWNGKYHLQLEIEIEA